MIEHLEWDHYCQSLAAETDTGKSLPRYSPPTKQFLEELTSPQIVEEDGSRHAIFTFNRQYLGDAKRRPVVATLTYEDGTVSRYGSTLCNALAGQLNRPLITIDLPGIGLSSTPTAMELTRLSIRKVADTRVRVLDQLGYEQVDLLGICIGGVVAARMATTLGDRAKNLLTYSTPGFEPSFIPRVFSPGSGERNMARTYQRMSSVVDKLSTRHFNFLNEDLLDTWGQCILMRLASGIGFGGARLSRLDTKLHSDTKWRDLLGAKDTLTSARKHEKTVARRNARHPASSSLTVLKKIGHEWSRERIVLTARDAEVTLSGQQ